MKFIDVPEAGAVVNGGSHVPDTKAVNCKPSGIPAPPLRADAAPARVVVRRS